jgi:hypothetical protein
MKNKKNDIKEEMIKNVSTMHKNTEEHCNYQIIVREIFRRIEESFYTKQFNPILSDITWEEFKEKILKEK